MIAIVLTMSIISPFIWNIESIFINQSSEDSFFMLSGVNTSIENHNCQINTPESTVFPINNSDTKLIRKVGIPLALITTLVTRIIQSQETQTTSKPDNTDLINLVKLIKSGISDKILAEQIRGNAIAVRPTTGDLLYLKENNVPEEIISMLMEAPVLLPPAIGEISFNGLVIRKLFRDRSGALVFTNDKFVWRDASKDAKSFELFMNGVRQINLFKRIRENGNFCYKIQFEFTKGHHYAFEDVQKDTGGNENLMHLVDYLKYNYPSVPFVDKNKS